MDKLNILATVFFIVSDAFAIASLSIPKWIVSSTTLSSDDNGVAETNIGLLRTCIKLYSRSEKCFSPKTYNNISVLTFLSISLGVISIAIAVIMLFFSHWRRTLSVARWFGFIGMMLFCIAAVIFPLTFDMEQIGGTSYQLPGNFQVGLSYVLFIFSLWMTVISELVAGKVCLPHF